MKTWVRRGDDPAEREGDIIIWIRTDAGDWYHVTNGGALKPFNIVGYEGQVGEWEPDAECFLAVEGDT